MYGIRKYIGLGYLEYFNSDKIDKKTFYKYLKII